MDPKQQQELDGLLERYKRLPRRRVVPDFAYPVIFCAAWAVLIAAGKGWPAVAMAGLIIWGVVAGIRFLATRR